MHITFEDLRRLCPRGDAGIMAEIARLASELLPQFGITTPRRWCHFIAQVATETGGLRALEENLNYSAERLVQVWPNRFPSIAAARPFAGNPEALAEKVYGGRMGNARSGDGWRFRGRGLKQLTGRENYERAGAATGLPLAERPELAAIFPQTFAIAGWYWASRRLNQYADQDDARMITIAVNGGTNGLTDRMRYLALAKRIWGEAAGTEAVAANGVRPTLRRGDAGEAVRILQQALNTPTVMREIDLRLVEDGQFGAGTDAALKAWQRIAGLTPDGVCGPATWASLDNLAQPVPDAAPAPKPPPPVDAPDPVEPEPAPKGGFFHALANLRRSFGGR